MLKIFATIAVALFSTVCQAGLISNASCMAHVGEVGESNSAGPAADTSVSCSASAGMNEASAEASGHAEYGHLQAFTEAEEVWREGLPGAIAIEAHARADAAYSDTVVILGTGSGFIHGYVSFSMVTVDATGRGEFSLAGFTGHATPSFAGPTDFDFITPIEFGVPFQIEAFLESVASPNFLIRPLVRGDFFFNVGTHEVFDEEMNLLSGYRYVTKSNAPHRFHNGIHVVIPEPSSFVIVVGGSLLLLLRRRAGRAG